MFRAVLAVSVVAAIVGISPPHASAEAPACAKPPETLANFETTAPPKPAPDTPFFVTEDSQRTLADYAGKGVIVNFWATWCAPCVREMPALDRAHAALAADGIDVLTISEDRDAPRVAPKFFDKNGIVNLEPLFDRRGKFLRSLNVPGLPTTVVFDRSGQEIGRVIGIAEWDDPESIAFLKSCLGARG